ncbi:hypothetical protein QE152_g20762 [Popillia japonica]|uniref:Retrotransposon gag domain-containing protein n=1 Tax=Popillia japonica TaxID=7064 RepID=A0AAW1KNW6_POPJA
MAHGTHTFRLTCRCGTSGGGELVAICNLLHLDYEGALEDLAEKIMGALIDVDSLRKENKKDTTKKMKIMQKMKTLITKKMITMNKKTDVENWMRTFDDSEDFSVEKCIEEFEDNAELMEWNDLHKYIFAKKPLRGLAKLYIQGEAGLNSWTSLKRALLKEFSNINSVKLHQTLRTRQIKKSESAQEYLLVVKDIASRGSIDDESLIQYVINGIAYDDLNKIVLYGSRNLNEFNSKLKYYEKLQKNEQSGTSVGTCQASVWYTSTEKKKNTGSSGRGEEEPKDQDSDVDKVSGSVTTRTADSGDACRGGERYTTHAKKKNSC